jgi:hypothetical protein
MGTRTTAVDPLALPIAAARLDAAADILNAALRTHLADVRSGVELAAVVARWESSVREVAAALRIAADRYLESEAHGAAALR